MDRQNQLAALKTAYKAIDDKMGDEVVMLDIREVSILAEYFIIASANNSNQLKAIAENVQKELAALGLRARSIEGVQSARWILIDFGLIIVHLFCREEREYYRLERLWGDAETIKPEDFDQLI